MIRVTDAIALDDSEVKERFVRASGPGGQNAKKEATAVELRFDIGQSRLPGAAKERLVAIAGRDVKVNGVLVVVSRDFSSQVRNRKVARARLLALLRKAVKVPRVRLPARVARGDRGPGAESDAKRRAVKASHSRGPLEQD
jgi:ribosome-associated protein